MFIVNAGGDTSGLQVFDIDGKPLRLMIRKIEIGPITEGVVSAVLTVDYVTLGEPTPKAVMIKAAQEAHINSATRGRH